MDDQYRLTYEYLLTSAIVRAVAPDGTVLAEAYVARNRPCYQRQLAAARRRVIRQAEERAVA